MIYSERDNQSLNIHSLLSSNHVETTDGIQSFQLSVAYIWPYGAYLVGQGDIDVISLGLSWRTKGSDIPIVKEGVESCAIM